MTRNSISGPLKTSVFWGDFLFQCTLLLIFVYLMSAGAFVLDWESHLFFSENPLMHRMLFAALLIFGSVLSWFRFKANLESFYKLPLIISIRVFFAAKPLWSVGFLFIAYFLTQWTQQCLMHAGLQTSLWDLGLYDQVIWNTAHGDFLVSSVRGGVHVFSERFKPALALFAPLYWISRETELILFVYTLIASSSLVAVYFITKKLTDSHISALSFAIAAFLYLPMRNGIQFLLHTQILADALLLFGFLALLKRSHKTGVFLLITAMCCKESVFIDVLGLSLFLFFLKMRIAKVVMLLAILFIAVFSFWIEPTFQIPTTFMNKWSFFEPLLRPGPEVLKKLLEPNPLIFLTLIFLPLAGLPLTTGGSLWLLGPSLGFRLLSTYGGFRLISAHYTAGMNALLFIGAIYGFLKMRARFSYVRLCIVLLFLSFLFMGVPQLFHIERSLWEASFSQNQRTIILLESVPADFSVLTDEFPAAHLSHRKYLFVFNEAWEGTPYEQIEKNPDIIIIDKLRLSENEQRMIDSFKARGYSKFWETQALAFFRSPSLDDAKVKVLRMSFEDALRDFEPVPYRKQARFFIKRGFVLFLLIAGIFIFVAPLVKVRKSV